MKYVIAVIVFLAVVVLWSASYKTDPTEQVIIIQFGKPVGEVVSEPGLHFKLPFIQEARRFDRRLLAWDGDPNQIPTRGREFISVDTTARWRIVDPLLFLKSVRDESGAQSRLDDIIDSVVRDNISSTDLVEIVRSKSWHVDPDDIDRIATADETEDLLTKKVEVGREQLEDNILEEAAKLMPQYGIELVDVRIKRLNYVPSVQQQVFQRMISERERIAQQFRSEGEGRSSEILGQTEREKAEILSEANRKAEVIRGTAEAEATRTYNEAYAKDPEFFAFYRTIESYSQSIGKGTVLVIGTDSDYFRYLRRVKPEGVDFLEKKTTGGDEKAGDAVTNE